MKSSFPNCCGHFVHQDYTSKNILVYESSHMYESVIKFNLVLNYFSTFKLNVLLN